ncbi:MAG: hypothetical protein KGI97_05410 [Alphaproteobacteria bacterium]|nr:hypothetical protein [Alphaproteobacteria bacterium]
MNSLHDSGAMKYHTVTRLFLVLGTFAALAALSACDTVADTAPVTPASVTQPPPQTPEETIPVIENPQTEIWRPGYWLPQDGQFIWIPGEVMHRPSPTAVWSPAHWMHHKYGWTLILGHWE